MDTEAAYRSPLEMQVWVARGEGQFQRPLHLGERPGTSLATSIRGAFGEALLESGCVLAKSSGACVRRPRGASGCLGPRDCPVRLLHRRTSPAEGRTLGSAVALWIDSDGASIQAEVSVWGAPAVAARKAVIAAIGEAGRRGLCDDLGKVPFTLDVKEIHRGSLRTWGRQTGPPPDRLLVEFSTPCHSRAADLPRIVGNMAHDLCQWDIEDRGLAPDLGRADCAEAGTRARRESEESFEGTAMEWQSLSQVDLGARASRTNSGRIALRGFVGQCLVSGRLAEAGPWLLALALRGAGGRRSFGLGRVRIWRPKAADCAVCS